MKPLDKITIGKGFAEQSPLTGDWLVYPTGERGKAPYVANDKPEAKRILKEFNKDK
jgi:hypothetical protein